MPLIKAPIPTRGLVAIAIMLGLMGLTGIAGTLVLVGLDATTAPILVTILSTLGLAMTQLIAVMRAEEAAKEAKRTAQQTQSDTATIAQIVQSNIADPHICESCGRGMEK